MSSTLRLAHLRFAGFKRTYPTGRAVRHQETPA